MKKLFIKISAVVFCILLLPYIISKFINNNYNNYMEIFNFDIMNHSNGMEEKLNFDEYLNGIIAASISTDYEYEAFKVQAVISRTYALHNILLLLDNNPNKTKFTTAEIGLKYMSELELEKTLGVENYTLFKNKIKNAIRDTKSEIIFYNNNVILPVFFNNSSGYTRSAEEAWGIKIPYLESTSSKYDINSSNYISIKEFSYSELSARLKNYFSTIDSEYILDKISIEERDSTGYVILAKVNGKMVSGEELSNALELQSSNFSFEEYEGKVRFICTGVGHGVGLSTYGANIMAKEGWKYTEILQHYYQGVEISNIIKPTSNMSLSKTD